MKRKTAPDGTIVAKYVYDVWGKILSIKDGSNDTIESTNATHLANLNPFRYRGYVYDNETGLYYLQSRYYDPITGRFLNADVYCDTGNSVLSTNMFAYCENNAVMKYDFTGEDAWWLQDTSAVWTMGHTSLLIQECPGRWLYFYWGDKSIKLIYIGTCTLDSLNKYLNSHYFPKVNEKYYDGTFNKRIKFKGDFYNSLTYIFNSLLHGSGKFYNYIYYSIFYNRSNKKLGEYDNPLYSLFSNNCMQVSIDVLLKGKFMYFNDLYREALKLARNCVVPNLAYKGLNSFNTLAISTNVTIAMLKNKIKWLKSYFD